MPEVSPLRRNLLRAYYLLILVERSVRIVPILAAGAPLEPFEGTAYAFWGALALLAVLGLRHPLAMLPLLLVHLAYKSLWLAAVALPLYSAGADFDPMMRAFTWAMAVGVALDLVLIPWPYVIARFVRQPAEPWRRAA